MGEGFQFLDIILFALVAGFLILRLRSVLGRRDGHQGRNPDPFSARPKPEPADDKVVQLPDRNDRPIDATATPGEPAAAAGTPKGPLEAGLTQIAVADPRFDPQEFVSGARIAFELILTAFASGDREALKPLLSPEVYGNFDRVDPAAASVWPAARNQACLVEVLRDRGSLHGWADGARDGEVRQRTDLRSL